MNKEKKLTKEKPSLVATEGKKSVELRIEDYAVTDIHILSAHHASLRACEIDENNRLTIIENKTSQMVTQTGVVFALLSLFIPTFIDKVADQPFYARVIFFGLLFLAFLFFALSIYFAARNFDVRKFIYARPDPKNIVEHKDDSLTEFLAIEIRDLLNSARRNSQTNNLKATNLNYSSQFFRIAILFTALLALMLCFLLLFAPPKKSSITIENPIRIENLQVPQNGQ